MKMNLGFEDGQDENESSIFRRIHSLCKKRPLQFSKITAGVSITAFLPFNKYTRWFIKNQHFVIDN
jgi:hypothetical protein